MPRQPVEAGSGGGCPVRRRSPLGLDRSTWIPGSRTGVPSRRWVRPPRRPRFPSHRRGSSQEETDDAGAAM